MKLSSEVQKQHAWDWNWVTIDEWDLQQWSFSKSDIHCYLSTVTDITKRTFMEAVAIVLEAVANVCDEA